MKPPTKNLSKVTHVASKGGAAKAQTLFNGGLALHQKGQLAEAQRVYRKVLKLHPEHFDALNMLGVIAAQSKNHLQAVELIGRAIEINPNIAESYINRGAALKDLKRPDEALASYEQAIKLKPDYAEAHYNRGNVLQDLRRLDDALASFEQAIKWKPDFTEAYHNRGAALKGLKRPDEALASFEQAIKLKPDYAEAYINRGAALKDLKRPDEALASFDQAIKLKPDFAEAYYNRGNALQALKRLDEALASYEQAIKLRPDYAGAYNNRGAALEDLERPDDALASYDQAIKSRPDFAEAYHNRGAALEDLGRHEEALASYDQAITLKPDYVSGHHNLSLCRLLMGDFARGWEGYEWRWKEAQLEKSTRDFTEPLWLGKESLAGKTILLHSEQGLGDTLQFCRYAKLVSELGARVIMEVPKALLGLLKNLDGVARLVVKGSALPRFDCHCPLLSLPLAFRTDLKTIPAPGSYIASNPSRVAAWQNRLGAKTKPRVGLAWSGNPRHRRDRNRSIGLAEMRSLLRVEIEWISLHKEVRDGDAALLSSSADIRHFGDEMDFWTSSKRRRSSS